MKTCARQRNQPASQLRRVSVQFAGDYPVMHYAADAATAWAISAAFAATADPIITVDDAVTVGLRPFPCIRLFQL